MNTEKVVEIEQEQKQENKDPYEGSSAMSNDSHYQSWLFGDN